LFSFLFFRSVFIYACSCRFFFLILWLSSCACVSHGRGAAGRQTRDRYAGMCDARDDEVSAIECHARIDVHPDVPIIALRVVWICRSGTTVFSSSDDYSLLY
jgi:hypothetical protein